MPKLSDLGLTQERVGDDVDYATMPDQLVTFQDPPQPGVFRFRLPPKLDDIWETFDATKVRHPGKRLAAVHDSSRPLTIIQSAGGKYDGLPFETRITNAERKRGKKDDQSAPEVSDMDYLFRDAFGIEQKPQTNVQYAQEYIKHAGQEFGADLEWNWGCRDDRNIRVDDGTGRTTEVPNQKGCGTRYYQSHVEKVKLNPDSLPELDPQTGARNPEYDRLPEVFPVRIQCQCGAMLRAFANMTRFRR